MTGIRTFLLATLACSLSVRPVQADEEFFEKKVRPILVEHCISCHGPDKQKGGLRLDSRKGWQKGGESGAAVIPGKPDESHFITAIRYGDADLQMPPKQKLAAAEIATLVEWIEIGAPDPRTGAVSEHKIGVIDYAGERQKWAYRQPVMPKVPEATGSPNPIDAFIGEKLAEKGLVAAKLANKRTLIRRATFDLTGLPPTPEEVKAFVANQSPEAFEKVVNRLLDSPRYGERWGRHWLDVVRYADSLDSRGMGKEGDILDAWRYRDWVVNAFNKDLPYNQFVMQQIAGDLLAAEQWDADKVVATGLYAIGNWGNGDSDKQKVYADIVDDQVDVTGRAFMGLTFACARCHDHKFDPISTADYYGLAGIFFSSHILDKFAAPTAGEKMMRIPLVEPSQQKRRQEMAQRIAVIDTTLANGLEIFNQTSINIAGKPGLVGWTAKGASNPSLTINTASAEVKFSTITLGANAICVHPGPKIPVTAVWRAPIDGKVSVRAMLSDADANCGNGIEWSVRHGSKTIASGVMANASRIEIPAKEVEVKQGDLLRLVIGPRGDYSCDSTQLDFVVTAGARRWSLSEAFVRQPQAMGLDKNSFVLAAGDAEVLSNKKREDAPLIEERQKLQKMLVEFPQCQGLQDGGIPMTAYEGFHDAKIHIRGRYDRLGEVVQRRFPVVLTGNESPVIQKGSGRLELAQWVASAEHPLTARVMVNRLWQHHFGEGIVRTPNNYGKLGTPPTHPELLDWLALKFIENGWSMKAMHRMMMLSQVYQRSSEGVTTKTDAENLWFGRQDRRRLSAEELRDALLVVTGTLDERRGGISSLGIKGQRRTLYVTTIRSDRSSYQMLFDGADPNTIVEKRNDSIVAPQALWLLNHPFALDQAKALSARAQHETGDDAAKRIAWIYDHLFNRAPLAEETAALQQALAASADRALAWEQVCHALLCSNEFAYVD